MTTKYPSENHSSGANERIVESQYSCPKRSTACR